MFKASCGRIVWMKSSRRFRAGAKPRCGPWRSEPRRAAELRYVRPVRTPSWTVRTLVIAGLLIGAALFIVVSIVTPPGNPSTGLRAWNIKILLALISLFFLAFAAMVLLQTIRRRSELRFAASLDADLVIPVYVHPLTRHQIHSALPGASSERLPTRAMIAASRTGLKLWGRPARRLATIPWSDIATVVPFEMESARSRFAGLSIQLIGNEGKVQVHLVGTGLLAIPSREQAVDVTAKIRALRA
ncbi:hypothetical protein ACFPJ4_13910 [Lysinimonas soli]|uniref:DUF1499 domain-containing protein n=1 Tax=Lysinimonas soli TaxID=1074233 RepID=A0ABW0NSG5_9MICO